MRRLLPFVLLCAPWACGDGDDPGPAIDARPGTSPDAAAPQPDAAVPSTCSMTISGVESGTFPCEATAGKNDDDGFSILGITSTGGGGISSLQFSARITGTLAVGVYANAQLESAVAAVTTGNNFYTASRGAGDDRGTIGTVHITGLELQPPVSGAKVWIPHGSVTAMLVGTTTVGMVTLAVTF